MQRGDPPAAPDRAAAVEDEETIEGPGGLPLFLRRFPADEESMLLVFLHGLGAHSGWYRGMGEELARRGVTSYAFDFPAHGRSGGSRGDIADITAVIDSLRIVIDRASTERPGRPLFIGGLSLGGLLALQWALLATRRDGPRAFFPAGTIAMCPPIADTYIPILKKIAMFATLLVRPRALYPCPLGMHVPITRNPRGQETVEGDPLALRSVTARTYYQILTVVISVILGSGRLQGPVLILQGAHDRVVSPHATRWFYERLTTPRKAFKLYADLGHDLKLEPEMPMVAADIVAWMSEIVAASGSPGA